MSVYDVRTSIIVRGIDSWYYVLAVCGMAGRFREGFLESYCFFFPWYVGVEGDFFVAFTQCVDFRENASWYVRGFCVELADFKAFGFFLGKGFVELDGDVIFPVDFGAVEAVFEGFLEVFVLEMVFFCVVEEPLHWCEVVRARVFWIG